MLLGYFIYTFPVVAVLSLLCYLPSVILQKKRHKRRRLLRHLTLYACIGVVWSILFLTIFWGGFPTQFPVEYHFMNAAGSLLGYGIFYMLHTCLRRKKWWSVMLGTEDMA